MCGEGGWGGGSWWGDPGAQQVSEQEWPWAGAKVVG